MGSQVHAFCECGLYALISIGGGRYSFMTICYFPCLCERCRDIVQVNLIPTKILNVISKKIRCPECKSTKIIPYDSPNLIGSPGEKIVARWNPIKKGDRQLILTDGKYKCPKCENMSLKFDESGICWD